MQTLTTAVLAAFAGALVVTGGYHLLVAAPRVRRLQAVLDTHADLLAGGAGRASERLAALDRAVADGSRERIETRDRLAALEALTRRDVPHIGFVRYNAFSDVGSDLSYALALLTAEGNGVVLSSLYSREDTRTYGKAIVAFEPAQDPSDEERAAIALARAGLR